MRRRQHRQRRHLPGRLLEGGETCDDGNTFNNDGCDSDPATCPSSAGDGICCQDDECVNGITNNNEECDDGNTVAGDCCSATCRLEPDPDGDGHCAALDNCPFYATANLADTDADGRGDACECGDQDGNGINDVRDLIAINLAVFRPDLATPLCDGNNDSQCNVSDIIAANVEIFSTGSTSTCARQPVPGP